MIRKEITYSCVTRAPYPREVLSVWYWGSQKVSLVRVKRIPRDVAGGSGAGTNTSYLVRAECLQRSEDYVSCCRILELFDREVCKFETRRLNDLFF